MEKIILSLIYIFSIIYPKSKTYYQSRNDCALYYPARIGRRTCIMRMLMQVLQISCLHLVWFLQVLRVLRITRLAYYLQILVKANSPPCAYFTFNFSFDFSFFNGFSFIKLLFSSSEAKLKLDFVCPSINRKWY